MESSQTDLSIFKYQDPSLFLRDHWLLKKNKNPSFSIRSWAQLLGIKSHSQLHQMLYGKRMIPQKYVPKIADHLKLSRKEADHLSNLISLKKSKTLDEKIYLHERIKDQTRDKLNFKDITHAEMISNPLHFFILEIVALEKKAISLELIRERLKIPINLFDLKRYLETLLSLGYLKEISPKTYIKSHEHFYTESKIPTESIRHYHKKILSLAASFIETQNIEEREYSGTTFSLNHKDIGEAKEMIREFREKFVQRFSGQDRSPNLAYHLEMSLFAISNKE